MKLLCLDIPMPGASPEKYQPHLLGETLHGWALYKNGIVRDIYFRQDRLGVAIIAECDSVDAARQALGEFPLAKAGLIDWEVIPLGPFLGWEKLFAGDSVDGSMPTK
jgi:hypothetical protein